MKVNRTNFILWIWSKIYNFEVEVFFTSTKPNNFCIFYISSLFIPDFSWEAKLNMYPTCMQRTPKRIYAVDKDGGGQDSHVSRCHREVGDVRVKWYAHIVFDCHLHRIHVNGGSFVRVVAPDIENYGGIELSNSWMIACDLATFHHELWGSGDDNKPTCEDCNTQKHYCTQQASSYDSYNPCAFCYPMLPIGSSFWGPNNGWGGGFSLCSSSSSSAASHSSSSITKSLLLWGMDICSLIV